jgi:hypothetical protein
MCDQRCEIMPFPVHVASAQTGTICSSGLQVPGPENRRRYFNKRISKGAQWNESHT